MATFKGQVTAVSPIQSGVSKSSQKQWRKVDVVLTYDNAKPEYPKAILFSAMNDNIEKFGFVQGNEYEVEVDFSVREYQGKHYMSASCWKATALNAAPQPQYQQPVQQTPQAQPQASPMSNDELPF